MTTFVRAGGRAADALRAVTLERHYTRHAEGSVLVEYGDTKVICTASVDRGVPRFMRGEGRGWLTAEYGMLPRSTNTRMDREAARGKQGGRTVEIQRLIGRSLRSALDLRKLGENTIVIDCDVIQADGGTRTASITGACVALVDALAAAKRRKMISDDPLLHLIASVSVGMYNGHAVLDLDYAEDSSAETDMNVIMTEHGDFVEVQGTAEAKPFKTEELQQMLDLARRGTENLVRVQKMALSAPLPAK